MIIVIDGPAGSGKSSTAKAIANRLNIQFLDSGALYRAITYLWIREGRPEKEKFFENLPDVKLSASYKDEMFKVFVNGSNITDEIRKHEVAESVSEIASYPAARKFVNNLMRNMVTENLYIADGRDLGTAVFPNADLKFFMNATLEERAKRRFLEMNTSDADITLDVVKENLRQRDHKDQTRSADPLKKADDAIEIDTTGKTFKEQLDEMISIIKTKLKL
ncbi:MAG: (d)CMP kinase [Balneolaceae bacterium]